MRKLYHRHPAFYLFERYKPYHRLARMSEASTRSLDGDGSPEIAIWRIDKGMQVGVLAPIAEVLVRHEGPTAEFADEILACLREWMQDYPAYRDRLVDAAGVWGGEMEQVAELRIEGLWQRWVWRQRRLAAINAYARRIFRFARGFGPCPDRRKYGLTSGEATRVRKRIIAGLNRHGNDFDVRRLPFDDLV